LRAIRNCLLFEQPRNRSLNKATTQFIEEFLTLGASPFVPLEPSGIPAKFSTPLGAAASPCRFCSWSVA
jgi:hypothetical protein